MCRILVFLLAVAFLAPPAFSQALPKIPVSPMQNSISGVMQQKMGQRGFAANDPRFGATLSTTSTVIGGVAGTTAAAVVAGAVTAPAWATVALAAGVGAVVTYAVTLGVDGLVKWLFGSDTIDVSLGGSDVSGAGIVLGGSYWSTGGPNGVIYGGDGIAVAREGYGQWASRWGIENSPSCEIISGGGIAVCTATQPDPYTGAYAVRQALFYSDGAPSSCNPGSYYLENSGCLPYAAVQGENIPGATPQQAITALPESELNKQLNPAVLAALANRAWQQAAAQPGYDGLPYQATDPITPEDAARWQQANPDYWPTVRDFVTPQPNPVPGTNANPWQLPNVSSPSSSVSPGANQSPSTNPASTQPQSNLGPDPGIGSPTLEQPPTAQQILAPILGMLPDLRTFSIGAHSGVCPKPSMELWEKTLVLDKHCQLIDDNRATLQAVMAAVWVMLALFTILAA